MHYERFICTVRPLQRGPAHKPREMVVSGAFQALDFVAFLPELWTGPARQALSDALELLAQGSHDAAQTLLLPYSRSAEDLPDDLRLRVLYNQACIESRLAELHAAKSKERKQHTRAALEHILTWLEHGQSGAWKNLGLRAETEVGRMIYDVDLKFLIRYNREKIRAGLLEKLKPLMNRASGGGSGGCITRDAPVTTPDGLRAIEHLVIGSPLTSLNLERREIVRASIRYLKTSRATSGILVNGCMRFSERQKLHVVGTGWVCAADLKSGDLLLDERLKPVEVGSVERLTGYFEFYSLTTSHHTHNFFAHGVLCSNEKM